MHSLLQMTEFCNLPYHPNYFIDIYLELAHVTEAVFLNILPRVPCLNNRPDPTLKTFFLEIVKMYAIFSTFEEISIKIQKLEIAEV